MDAPPIFSLFLKLSPLWFCFGCGWLFFRGLAARNWISQDGRVAWAFTVVLMGCLYVGIAECAGAVHQLTRGTVLGAWLAVDAALLVAVLRLHKPTPAKIVAGLKEGWGRLLSAPYLMAGTPRCGVRSAQRADPTSPDHPKSHASRPFSPPTASSPFSPRWNAALLVLAAALVLLVGYIAIWCPTNVWDSLTYHVPRVMHWLQQRSLANYPTNILRQLESAPGAELQTSTLVLLSGDDWPLNLPQWWAFLTCALLAGLLAEQFLTWHFGKAPLDAAKVRFCGLFAALFALTVPQGVTQAISTQNDFMSSQWILLLAVFAVLLAREPANRWYAAGVGAAFALGVNNKPTMFIYAAPFALALAVWAARKSLRLFLTVGLAAAAFTLPLNLPWMARNYQIFHSPLGSEATRKMQPLENHAPAKMAANLIRNLGLYATTPFTPATRACNDILRGLFGLFGEPEQDTGSVWHEQMFRLPTDSEPPNNSEVKNGDGLGGIVTALPPLLAAVFFLVKFKWKSPVLLYPVLVFAGFALFSAYLKWQPWHQRLHLPFFILAAPFAGMVLGWVWNRWCVLASALLLAVNALLLLYYNPTYPIYRLSQEPFLTREERYFCWRPDLYPCTSELARDLVQSGVTNVFLKIGVDTWEYPLWVCLKNRGFQGTIQHAFVDNESGASGAPNLDAPGTAILSEDAAPQPPPDFGLAVGYDNWSARFRGKPENRIKLIANRALIGLSVPQPCRLELHCDVMDQNGRPVSNNIIHLQTASGAPSADFARDYPLTPAPLVLECPLRAGPNRIGLFLVNPPSPEQRILTLANVTTKTAPP